MSRLARTLLELHRLAASGCGALTDHLLRAIADELIQGV
jgi:hypothetical protein